MSRIFERLRVALAGVSDGARKCSPAQLSRGLLARLVRRFPLTRRQQWILAISVSAFIFILSYSISHSYPDVVRTAASAPLATASGACWFVAAMFPSHFTRASRLFNISAAVLAFLSGTCLLP
jgi:hypothetical protein